MKKGDIVLIRFGFDPIEAKVIAIYGDSYIKVRRRADWTDRIIPYIQIIPVSRVIGVIKK